MDQKRRDEVTIRPMTPGDVPAVVALQRRAYPSMPGWDAESLRRHLELFPEGQLVAVDRGGLLLGSASSLLIDWDDYAESANWSAITGGGSFKTHNPLGKTLYGADMAVLPEARRRGIGTLFYDARKRLIRERGLKRLLVGGRIPGYAEAAGPMSPREYVAEVTTGRRRDATLSFQLANGLVVLDVVEGYLADPESRGFATLLEWINPEYQASLGLREGEPKELARAPASPKRRQGGRRRVRVAAVQYLLRPIAGFSDFATQVEFFVKSARDYRCQFLLFPEFFTMQLLSYLREPAPALAVRRLAALTAEYEALFLRLARENRMHLIAGTHPISQGGLLFNAAHLFTPSGRVFRQKKVHLTSTERGPYQLQRGHGFYLIHTELAKIAILVCYDVEFPEAARLLAESGAEILFVPACTDNRQGFLRVRRCAHARAIENQLYVVVAGTVGNLPEVPHMSTHYGQAAVLTPSDYAFPPDGVAAEATANQEQMIVADLDLELLREQSTNGTVLPLQDMIKDAYDRVIHQVDAPAP